MLIGRVLGSATASLKHESMRGYKMLLVQPHQADGVSPDGDPILAIDGVGAGPGEMVIITSDGRGARELLKTEATPVRWTICGICD
jgi:microcompartment protein CcmK/EutM